MGLERASEVPCSKLAMNSQTNRMTLTNLAILIMTFNAHNDDDFDNNDVFGYADYGIEEGAIGRFLEPRWASMIS